MGMVTSLTITGSVYTILGVENKSSRMALSLARVEAS
jgi:hypothetical protein